MVDISVALFWSVGFLPSSHTFSIDPLFRRYDTVPNSVDVESSSASHNSSFDVDPRPGPSGLSRNDEPTDESLSSNAVHSDVQGEIEISNTADPLPVSAQAPIDRSVATLPGLLSYASMSNGSSGSSSEKICLICLEPLSPEDFESGQAIRLDCQCKGDAALRHKDCAQKWVDIKGDLTCDVCRTPIANLSPPQPRSDAGSQQASDDPTDASRGRYPSATDVFDCIRMTWVVTIVCILFFKVTIVTALVTGNPSLMWSEEWVMDDVWCVQVC